jgi:dTMP kinase
VPSGGPFVVLEGGEGVGKTTQWEQLREWVRASGQPVLALREPGGTPPGDILRALLLDPVGALAPETEALLFAASRAELLARAVRPALAQGTLVLLDRYLLSTYVYQGVARGLAAESLRAINQFATGGLVPDLTLLLSLPLEEAQRRTKARGAPDRLEQEANGFHARVASGFATVLSPEWQQAHPECGPIVAVDATGTREAVTARCIRVLAERWPEHFARRTGTTSKTT